MVSKRSAPRPGGDIARSWCSQHIGWRELRGLSPRIVDAPRVGRRRQFSLGSGTRLAIGVIAQHETAPLFVLTQVVAWLARMSMASRTPWTNTGDTEDWFEPLPSWPMPLAPQHATRPDASSAQEWFSPRAICSTRSPGGNATSLELLPAGAVEPGRLGAANEQPTQQSPATSSTRHRKSLLLMHENEPCRAPFVITRGLAPPTRSAYPVGTTRRSEHGEKVNSRCGQLRKAPSPKVSCQRVAPRPNSDTRANAMTRTKCSRSLLDTMLTRLRP